MEPEPRAEDPGNLAARIAPQLRTKRFGRPLHVHAVATSTNDVARELAAGGAPEGTAVLALEQSAGRGRLGRRWMSPPGGLYLSVVLRPAFPMERWPLIGFACALGTAAAAEAHVRLRSGFRESVGRDGGGVGVPVRLKWPNDLLLDGQKVGGILVEASGDAAICGIGVNVIRPTRSGPSRTGSPGSIDNPQPDSPGSAPAAGERTWLAGSIEATWLGARNPAVSVAGLAPDVLLECERRYAALAEDPNAVLTEWRSRTVTLGLQVRVDVPEPFEGVAVDVDAGGALLVQTASGIRRVLAGEVI